MICHPSGIGLVFAFRAGLLAGSARGVALKMKTIRHRCLLILVLLLAVLNIILWALKKLGRL